MATLRKTHRTARRPARDATLGASIPWASPEQRLALNRELDQLWAHWAMAAEFAPQIEEAYVIAMLLKALREARRLGDERALGLLETGARAALDQMAPAIAAETHAHYMADGTLVPGVTVADLMPMRLQRKGAGRKGDAVDAALRLAEQMDCYLTTSSRQSGSSGAPLSPLTADAMARGFVHSFAHRAGPIGRKLKRRGLLPVHPGASYDAGGIRAGSDLDVKIKVVTAAFEKQLEKTSRTNGPRRWLSNGRSLATVSSGEDLVRVGLRALGMSAKDVKHLYDAASQRAKRQ
jgi:hypothetical protein